MNWDGDGANWRLRERNREDAVCPPAHDWCYSRIHLPASFVLGSLAPYMCRQPPLSQGGPLPVALFPSTPLCAPYHTQLGIIFSPLVTAPPSSSFGEQQSNRLDACHECMREQGTYRLNSKQPQCLLQIHVALLWCCDDGIDAS